MEKNRVKGKTKDIAGRAQRQVGEWTGDENAEPVASMRRKPSVREARLIEVFRNGCW